MHHRSWIRNLLARIAGDHEQVITKPTALRIGRPAQFPPITVVNGMRAAVAETGVSEIYWFWMQLGDEAPRLGLAITPADRLIADRVGQAIEPIWRMYRPEDPAFSVLSLDDPELSETVRSSGLLLYRAGG